MKPPFFITAILAASLLALSGCDNVPETGSTHPKVAEHKKWPRAEFKKLAMGQPDSVVLSKFGQPYLDNNYAGQFGILWTYKNITFDPASGRQDQFATVVFEHGVVTKVIFK